MGTSDHGIVLRQKKNVTTVSCKCRAVYSGPGSGRGKHGRLKPEQAYHAPMDWPKDLTAFAVYNKPENHNAPFTDGDKINA